jgi:hypothetical protein
MAFFILLVGLPIAQKLLDSSALALFDAFYRSGALVFGGGHVVLPLLRDGAAQAVLVRFSPSLLILALSSIRRLTASPAPHSASSAFFFRACLSCSARCRSGTALANASPHGPPCAASRPLW